MRVFPVILAVLSSACYQYVPVRESEPFPMAGAEVRAQLTSGRAYDLGGVTLSNVTAIEGDVYSTENDSLAVWSRWLHSSFGQKVPANGAVFYVPRGDITVLEERRLSPGKTGLAVGAAAAGLILIVELADRFGGGGNPGDGPPVDELQVVSPLAGAVRIIGFKF